MKAMYSRESGITVHRFPLANVLVLPDDFASGHPELYYRAETAAYHEDRGALSFSGSVDFSTYFNALSLGKWKRYTGIDTVKLELEVAGDACEVFFAELREGADTASLHPTPFAVCEQSEDFSPHVLKLPESDAPLVSFAIKSCGTSFIRSARFFTEVEPSAVRSVRLALCTTTFRKEEFIVPNIEAIKREVLESAEPISKAFHMYVVDNGRTLDVKALSDEGVTIIPNANTGGAGGFARGMLAGLEGDATHLLLMDDDVRVSPESFKRAFNLLSLVNDKYREAFLNGAMLSIEQPTLQYEDVARVREDGVYDKIKPDLHVDRICDLVKNETIDVEVENAYGAWWFCCIPASAVRKHGLPLPLFIRCDDVEYGMRCQPTMMCMGGICVWHDGFEGRFRAAVDCYQYVRNFLILIAVDNKSSERMFMLRFLRTFNIYLRSMNYESAELMLDGLEDYLKGPNYLAHVDSEALVKRNSAKNERLVPIAELDRNIMDQVEIDRAYLGTPDGRGMLSKLLEAFPHDRHMLPDALLSSKPASVYYSRGAYPGLKTMRRKTLVAFDAEGEKGHIRTMDRERYRALRERYRCLKREYNMRKAEVAAEYHRALPYLTSEDFWRSYLDLDGDDRQCI